MPLVQLPMDPITSEILVMEKLQKELSQVFATQQHNGTRYLINISIQRQADEY